MRQLIDLILSMNERKFIDIINNQTGELLFSGTVERFQLCFEVFHSDDVIGITFESWIQNPEVLARSIIMDMDSRDGGGVSIMVDSPDFGPV